MRQSSQTLFFSSCVFLILFAKLAPAEENSAVKSPDGRGIVKAATGALKTPYRFGGRTARGVDCSAFTQRVYAANGIKIPRTVKKQAKHPKGQWVQSPQAGDLVFFKNTYKRGFSHVGVYVGNNQMIHASTTSGKVERASLSNPYFARHFSGYKRFVSTPGEPFKSVEYSPPSAKGSSAPFWLVATGMAGGVFGGVLSSGADNRFYFAAGGALLFSVGVTWGHLQKVSLQTGGMDWQYANVFNQH